jgi:hypothetical protein
MTAQVVIKNLSHFLAVLGALNNTFLAFLGALNMAGPFQFSGALNSQNYVILGA